MLSRSLCSFAELRIFGETNSIRRRENSIETNLLCVSDCLEVVRRERGLTTREQNDAAPTSRASSTPSRSRSPRGPRRSSATSSASACSACPKERLRGPRAERRPGGPAGGHAQAVPGPVPDGHGAGLRGRRRGRRRASWRELVDAGVFSLRVPEADGGVGLGAAEAVLVFEELGRALVPGPLVATAPGRRARRRRRRVVGVRRAGARHRWWSSTSTRSTGSLVLDDDGVWSLDPGGSTRRRSTRPLDPLTPVHAVSWPRPRASRWRGADEAARWRLDGAVLSAALLVGIAVATTDLAVAYAKERQQFDRPIGSFQAVKHLLADMLVRAEVARAAVHAAGVTLDDPDVGRPRPGRSRGQAHWPATPPCATARPASRSTGAWASPGRSTPTSTSSGPGSSTRRSARATTTPRPWPPCSRAPARPSCAWCRSLPPRGAWW